MDRAQSVVDQKKSNRNDDIAVRVHSASRLSPYAPFMTTWASPWPAASASTAIRFVRKCVDLRVLHSQQALKPARP